MIIKRVTGGSSKSVALGRPRGIHKEGNSIIFTVDNINANSPTFWRVQISEHEIEDIAECFGRVITS